MDQQKSEANAAIVTAVSQEHNADERKKKKKPKSGKKKKRHHQEEFSDIPGVVKVIVSPQTQKFMGFVVSEQVTAEKPWKRVKKDTFEDHLDLYEDSEFLPIKAKILQLKRDEIVVGYIPDEAREYDEFYICVTEEADDRVSAIIEKRQQELQARLNNAIHKNVRPWVSLGAEIEVDDEIIKNNRPLLEVEVETEYPIMSTKVHFKMRNAEDVRDGYAEILPSDLEPVQTVVRKRIDASVQVTAALAASGAQTVCTYPKNAYTQYEYNCDVDADMSEECMQNMRAYFSDKMSTINDFLELNGHINLYDNDYARLVKKESVGMLYQISNWTEYLSFTDINLCKNKMISAVSWHPMWTGVVALAYVDIAPNVYRTGPATDDEVNRVVHGVNPVLMWSFVDGLHPRLVLEAHREVLVLLFCPFDENIIIGGCANGQVIIWDIRNKLKHVEEEEILTTDQQNYRNIMNSLMKWMKNIRDIKLVSVAAVSDVEYSHRGPITSIQWVNPCWEIIKTGQFMEIPEEQSRTSFQFITASSDGSVLVWDLLKRPTLLRGSYRPQRKLKRLEKRPSALTVDVSPFRSLNRILKPIFRINTTLSEETKRRLALSSLNIKFGRISYAEAYPHEKTNLKDRVIYKPVLIRPDAPPKLNFCGGSPDGDVFIANWEGFEYDAGEVVNSQNCRFESIGKYHDGPVTTVARSQYNDYLLSVGGRIFAIWLDSFKNKPIFWRRSRVKYTHGCWSTTRIAFIKLTRTDGYIEIWHLLNQSNVFTSQENTSSGVITGSYIHPRSLNRNVMGLADANGSFRIFYNPPSMQSDSEEERKMLVHFFRREIKRKNDFIAWQTNWVNKHASWIKEQQRKAMEDQERKAKEEAMEKQRLEEERALLEKEKSNAAKQMRPPPGQYAEWATEQWNRREEERMGRVLLSKKRLDKAVLEKQHVPIKKYAEDRKKKKQKQEERLGQAENIFNENVAILFPGAIKERATTPPDPYAGADPIETKKRMFDKYNDMSGTLQQFVDDHPFSYTFDWKTIIKAGRERRRLLDAHQPKITHKDRYEAYKRTKEAFKKDKIAAEDTRSAGSDVSDDNMDLKNEESLEEVRNEDAADYGAIMQHQ